MSLLSSLLPANFRRKLKRRMGAPDMYWSIQNMKANGFNPKRIIDIGAYQGEWTREVLTIFPKASFLMIEAQRTKEPFLSTLAKQHPEQVTYAMALLGAKEGDEVEFHEMETSSSVLSEHYDTPATITKKKITQLDVVTKQLDFKNTDFLKLDTQGYELEILKGGESVLGNAEAVLMEVSLLDIHQNVPLMQDVLNFMADRNFQAYDICSFTRRPLDKALWQTDIVFVKKDSNLIADKRYG